MILPDALSRCHPAPGLSVMGSSPEEEDPHFPSIEEKVPVVTLPNGDTLSTLLLNRVSELNHITSTQSHQNPSYDYDADTEEDKEEVQRKWIKRRSSTKSLESNKSRSSIGYRVNRVICAKNICDRYKDCVDLTDRQ